METINARISQEHLDQFEQEGFMLLDNLFTKEESLSIANWVIARHHAEIWAKAQIGKGLESTIDLNQRGDFIQWLNQDENNSNILPYWNWVEAIRLTLNRNFYLGLNFFEAHMACYPSGAFYKRHSDRHRNGSSRRVSFVYYLNENWSETDGGLLNIFNENDNLFVVTPMLGNCIVFLSEMEHEVTESRRERYSITGWFHQK